MKKPTHVVEEVEVRLDLKSLLSDLGLEWDPKSVAGQCTTALVDEWEDEGAVEVRFNLCRVT